MRKLKDIIASVNGKGCTSTLGLECDTPQRFVQCQWQKEDADIVPVIYLIYRFLHAFFFVFALGWSIYDSDKPNSPEGYTLAKWPIYLTHWGFTLCTAQALMALGLVLHHLVKRRKGTEKLNTNMKMSYKVYWVLHSTAASVALGITGSYFVVEYDPGRDTLTALNLLQHAFNSVLMVIDVLVVAHPFRLLHCYWPVCFSIIYFCFSVIYYWAGGTGRQDSTSIYPALNWETPGKTMPVVVVGLLYLILSHCFLWLLVTATDKLVCKQANATVNQQAATASNNTQQTVVDNPV